MKVPLLCIVRGSPHGVSPGTAFSLPMVLLRRYSIFLAVSASCVYHCFFQSFTHCFLRDVYSLVSQAFFWTLGESPFKPTTFAFCVSIKPACRSCQGLLLTQEIARLSCFMTVEFFEYLHDLVLVAKSWETNSLDDPS